MKKFRFADAGASALSASFLLCVVGGASAAVVDVSRLPPAADKPVDFRRDVQPIFEATCWRCHGPARPKGGFRLDNRASALKGGANGIDIIPGHSTDSPLIHYVARLVEDMEMPPSGKGDPLTPEQVGILRAWIDQGVTWSTNEIPKLAISVEPVVGGIGVKGDKRQFRALEGIAENWAGGIESFSLTGQSGPDVRFATEGRALSPSDFLVKLSLDKADLGFVHTGAEQWRKYYDGTGGYDADFTPPAFSLNKDLYLDIGRAWFDFGLTLPRAPVVVLGYEYQFQNGSQSTLQWGTDPAGESGRKFYPAYKDIAEHTHILKLDLAYDISNWHLEDNARLELREAQTVRHDPDSENASPGFLPVRSTLVSEGASDTQGANAFHLEKQLTDRWFLAGGYFYAKFNGDSAYRLTTVDSAGLLAFGSQWFADRIELSRESHIFSLATSFAPFPGLNLSGGFQDEYTRQSGFGPVNLDEGDPSDPNFLLQPGTVDSNLNKHKYSETAALRFTRIPFTVLFADARLDQESVSQYEEQLLQPSIGGQTFDAYGFERDTDFSNHRGDWRAGFNTSPWRSVSLSAHYRSRFSASDYNHPLDDYLSGPSRFPNEGYSAFITHRDLDGDEIQAKLVLRPTTWLKTAFTFQTLASDYATTTAPVSGSVSPGGAIDAGIADAQSYSAGLALTSGKRFSSSATFSYRHTRTTTADNGSPASTVYAGDVYSLLTSASFIVNAKTDLNATYLFSRADYGQDRFATGLPLGTEFVRNRFTLGVTRRFSARVAGRLRYSFYQYNEPNHGSVNAYIAHGVFASLAFKW